MQNALRTASRFLDDHWVLKWFVAPILFMASMLFALALFVGRTGTETVELVGLFVAFSLAVVAVGLVAERAVAAITGGSLFGADRYD